MKLGWSTDFIVVDGERPALDELPRIDRASANDHDPCRAGGAYIYVFSRDEFFERLRRSPVPYHPASTRSLVDVIDLHETQRSNVVTDSSQVAPPDLAWRQNETAPSVQRYVEVDPAQRGKVLAVGGADVRSEHRTRAISPRFSAPGDGETRAIDRGAETGAPETSPAAAAPQTRGPRAAPPTEPPPIASTAGAEPAEPTAPTAPAEPRAPAVPDDDEGTTPVRHPSIEPVAPLAPGAKVTLLIDLLHEASPNTSGGPLLLAKQAAEWRTIELGVTVVSSAIDFDQHGRGKITIRRNDASVPARLSGSVLGDVAEGAEIEVHAQFWAGTRCCGSAVRRLVVGAAQAEPIAVAAASVGAIRVEPDAQPPDLSVYITLFDRAAPGRMHWRMVSAAFDGLPPQLDGVIDLGQDPAAEAAAMFKQFANLERGKHRARIEGFGERLWDRAPAEFRAVYWALHEHYQRPLTIQFVSDDPHLPWELMRPFRNGETHPPLALRHAVARWIGRWQGFMRNRLPAGRLVTIAPKYPSASARLSLAEATAAQLVSSLGAEAMAGTLESMQGLLETPTGGPVAVLYFTGHGAFNAEAVVASAIKLQDGNMTVDEVARREVCLGERDGTLVFFNACEVGATASALGSVGGWADAFLSRRFRAFIAPLWAIDEEDAAQVTQELMTQIVTERAPVGAALRDLRAKHGDVSPTFYSYLLYGDVTARLDAGA
jgi:hypothetical protein